MVTPSYISLCQNPACLAIRQIHTNPLLPRVYDLVLDGECTPQCNDSCLQSYKKALGSHLMSIDTKDTFGYIPSRTVELVAWESTSISWNLWLKIEGIVYHQIHPLDGVTVSFLISRSVYL